MQTTTETAITNIQKINETSLASSADTNSPTMIGTDKIKDSVNRINSVILLIVFIVFGFSAN